eukprot:557337-Rhodomonas_salina.1
MFAPLRGAKPAYGGHVCPPAGGGLPPVSAPPARNYSSFPAWAQQYKLVPLAAALYRDERRHSRTHCTEQRWEFKFYSLRIAQFNAKMPYRFWQNKTESMTGVSFQLAGRLKTSSSSSSRRVKKYSALEHWQPEEFPCTICTRRYRDPLSRSDGTCSSLVLVVGAVENKNTNATTTPTRLGTSTQLSQLET